MCTCGGLYFWNVCWIRPRALSSSQLWRRLAQKWFRWLRKSCADILLGIKSYHEWLYICLSKIWIRQITKFPVKIRSKFLNFVRMCWQSHDVGHCGWKAGFTFLRRPRELCLTFVFFQTFQIWDCRDFKWDEMLKGNYGIRHHATVAQVLPRCWLR